MLLPLVLLAAACDGSPVPDPAPTPSPAGDGTRASASFEGMYVTGFERSVFYPGQRCPSDGAGYWLAWSPESRFEQALAGAGASTDGGADATGGEGSERTYRVRFTGALSAEGRYGHLGMYSREVVVTAVLDVQPAESCAEPRPDTDADREEPPTGDRTALPAPPALTARVGDASVQLGTGGYCWSSTLAGGPGVCVNAVGWITNATPLHVTAGEEVSLTGALRWAEATMAARARLASDAVSPVGAGFLLVRPASADSTPLDVAASASGASFTAALPAGRQLITVSVTVPQGNVSYGLLVEVSPPPGTGTSARPERPFTLTAGQAIHIADSGWTLAFEGVLHDSRCPVDVTCVWAGEARVQFRAASVRKHSAVWELSTAGAPVPAPGFDRYEFELLELRPPARSNRTIDPSAYEVTAVVHEVAGLGDGPGLHGVVTLGPRCPVMRPGLSCPDAPHVATLVLRDSSNVEVARVTSDQSGRYRLTAPPGAYSLVPQRPAGQPLPFATPIDVTVPPQGWARIDVPYDSGIR